MKKTFLKFLPLLALTACYDPEPFVDTVELDQSGETASSEMGTIFPINVDKQICNPSVTQDTVNYPGAMLWLNFGKTLNVIAPDTIYNVTTNKVKRVIAHDRLTVSDTAGRVLWYVMRDEEGGDCVFQDPEWSTHPNYIMSLRAFDVSGNGSCADEENFDYGIISIRMSDKKRFTFYSKNQSQFSTPHLWVDPSVSAPDTSFQDTTLKGFFGTENVRLVFVDPSNNIIFRDFANGGKEVKLKLPQGHKGKMMDSPLISPDGNFIVYNAVDQADGTIWNAYIQELSANSSPVEIKKEEGMMSAPAQPHWFKYGNRLFVVWAEFAPEKQMLNTDDFTKASAQNKSVGRTVMREISLAVGAPADLAVEWIGSIRELAAVPMTGGRSPDGKFLATGTNNGYMIELP